MKYTDEQLEVKFRQYLSTLSDMKDPTDEVEILADELDNLLENKINDRRLVSDIFMLVMDIGYCYHRKGFNAGMRYKEPSHTAPKSRPTNNTKEDKKSAQSAIFGSNTPQNVYITSTEIGKMFCTNNSLVCKRIREQILPKCDDRTRSNFFFTAYKENGTRKRKEYWLNLVACNMYLEHMKKFDYISAVSAGVWRLEKAMEERFGTNQN